MKLFVMMVADPRTNPGNNWHPVTIDRLFSDFVADKDTLGVLSQQEKDVLEGYGLVYGHRPKVVLTPPSYSAAMGLPTCPDYFVRIEDV